MKTETREVYKCEYCNKMYQRKHFCEHHENMCFKNPKNDRPCFGCVFLTKKDVKFYSGYSNQYGDEHVDNSELLFCEKKEICLHTPKNEIKGNAKETIDFENEPMPIECNLKM